MADLTTKQAAERFGVEPPAVRQWCRRGLLPNAYEAETPRGSVWMIPETDLEGFKPPRKTGRPSTKKGSKKDRRGE
jgi:hypothetical protein